MKVANIWAVGRNFAAHAKELGNPLPSRPLIFLKSGSCIVTAKQIIPVCKQTLSLNYELEIALQLGKNLEISAIGLALDLTDRAEQEKLRAKQEPWTLAKSFKYACPISEFIPISQNSDYDNLELKLWQNQILKQNSTSKLMLFSIPALHAYICQHFPVQEGDLILTGTPEGVGPVNLGDQFYAELKQNNELILSANWNFDSKKI